MFRKWNSNQLDLLDWNSDDVSLPYLSLADSGSSLDNENVQKEFNNQWLHELDTAVVIR